MRKIQLFASGTIDKLQLEINQWLSGNREARIIETNITSLGKVSMVNSGDCAEGHYAFYILYELHSQMEENVLSAQMQINSELTDTAINEGEINN